MSKKNKDENKVKTDNNIPAVEEELREKAPAEETAVTAEETAPEETEETAESEEAAETDEESEAENEEETDDDAGEEKTAAVSTELFEWGKALTTAVVFIVVLFTFFFRIEGVSGSSMYPTLENGDRVLLQCIGYEPERGDIVVLTKRTFADESIIKRVIATEGQYVDIDFTTGNVWVDGELQYEPYINEPTLTAGDTAFPLIVKEGCILVMGDNRNASTDSRVSSIGQVDKRCVIGGLVIRVFPFSGIGKVN